MMMISIVNLWRRRRSWSLFFSIPTIKESLEAWEIRSSMTHTKEETDFISEITQFVNPGFGVWSHIKRERFLRHPKNLNLPWQVDSTHQGI